LSKIRRIAGLALLALGLLLMHAESLISLVTEARSPKDLGVVGSWCYQPDAVDFKTLSKSGCDVLVIDADDVTRAAHSSKSLGPVRMNSDGTRRTVLAYLDIGEAETQRLYWRHAWQANPPVWIVRQNEAWRGSFKVRYWSPQWQDIIYGGSDSRLASILKSGFDGVYLDNVDAYADLLPENPEARSQMIAFVASLAREARAKRPRFKIIVQGAEELLTEPVYLGVIDGVAKEDLLFGIEGVGVRNRTADIGHSVRHLHIARQHDKPVFIVEYLEPTAIENARNEIMREGFIPYFAQHRRCLECGREDATRPAAHSP
jgi:cysteinyl-tRNA synthetase, unknown class